MTEYEVDIKITGRLYIEADSQKAAEEVAVKTFYDRGGDKGPLKHMRVSVWHPLREWEEEE